MLSSPITSRAFPVNRQTHATRFYRAVDVVDLCSQPFEPCHRLVGHFVQSPESCLTNGALPRPIVPIFGISKKQHLETTSFGFVAAKNGEGGRSCAAQKICAPKEQ